LLQTNLVPYGLGVGFVVVNLVLNEIYVFDDINYQRVNKQPSMLLPFPGQSKFWSIEKRPEHAAVALKRMTRAVQRKVARETVLDKVPLGALAVRDEEKKDEALMNAVMAVVFAVASSYYAWQAKKGMVMQVPRLNRPTYIPRQISLTPNPLAQPAHRPAKQVLPQKAPEKCAPVARKPAQKVAGMWSLNSSTALLSPRARFVIAASALVALQLSHQTGGWLTKDDLTDD
jgi:hypothetical protein